MGLETLLTREYDASGRMLSECAFQADASGAYIPTACKEAICTATADGGEEIIREVYVYTADGTSRTLVGKELFRYDTSGNLLYSLTGELEDGEWYDTKELLYVYDENGRKQTEDKRNYFYYDDGDESRRSILIRYDANGNLLSKEIRNSNSLTGDVWENESLDTYVYENDSEVEHKRYSWEDGGYVLSYATGIKYDFDISAGQVIEWQYNYFPGFSNYYGNRHHMIEEIVRYGSSLEFPESVARYYYSDFLPTGVSGIEDNDAFQLKSSAVTDYLEIEGEGEANVRVYNLQGVLMLTSSEKMVSVEHLADGVYVVDLNGNRTKIVKR